MEIGFLEYKVRNGDTLKSIASRLGMTGEELKLFHNTHCKKLDTIWFENLNEVRSIFVPLDFKTEKQKDEERKTKLPLSQLSESFFAKTYTISESIEGPFESSVNIDYTIELNVHKDRNKNLYILAYSQKNFKSNGNPPDDKMGGLSIACMKSIMPIEFILNDFGKIIGFADHKKIVKNFTDQRKEIEDFYIGEVSQKYMDLFERNIADETFFLQQFQSTLLFQTLFPKMDWFHKKASRKESFYFLQNSFPVQCNMIMEQKDEDHDLVSTVLKGQVMEPCSSQEIMRGIRLQELPSETASGDIILEYTTHNKNKNLLQVKSSVYLHHEEELIHQHKITITQG
ncbi:LysM peptidoglycan-binding domain-containing protein [Chryseobacterium aurantiacum]|uniref:LysM peptidoglycan-binding domain-containing protein n=1 Tax=Chryseobacterium aurantiacum TaxID=2116499 RepID=UPI000D130D73|nr:LysM peptidoglycan-binding domain-containing protein [Chryseobacterium aurantiacum]